MPILIDGDGSDGDHLDLCAVWFNTAADLLDAMSFTKAGDSISVNTTARAEARQLIGRVRLVTTGIGDQVQTTESWTATLYHCSREQVAWLRAHTGRLMCVRDHVGTKFYGFYRDLPREVKNVGLDWIDVKIDIAQVTHSEAV